MSLAILLVEWLLELRPPQTRQTGRIALRRSLALRTQQQPAAADRRLHQRQPPPSTAAGVASSSHRCAELPFTCVRGTMIAPAAGQPLGMLAAAADGLAAAALLADHNACTPARRALARRNYLFASRASPSRATRAAALRRLQPHLRPRWRHLPLLPRLQKPIALPALSHLQPALRSCTVRLCCLPWPACLPAALARAGEAQAARAGQGGRAQGRGRENRCR